MTTDHRPPTLELWVDPICPWAWATSRWVDQVVAVRGVDVRWRVMSLSVLNEHRDLDPAARHRMDEAWLPVRVLTAARLAHGDGAVKPLYDAIGTRWHLGGRRDLAAVVDESLVEVGLPAGLAEAGTTPDTALRADHAAAMAAVGQESGTPVLAVGGVGFHGPVLSPVPRGEPAGRLWDAIVLLAGVPGFAELSRVRAARADLG